jgi:hypothetical protein
VLLRFEEAAKVQAWISNGRLGPADLYLGGDQGWHPLSEMHEPEGAMLQMAPPPASGRSGPVAKSLGAEEPSVSPSRKKKPEGPVRREAKSHKAASRQVETSIEAIQAPRAEVADPVGVEAIPAALANDVVPVAEVKPIPVAQPAGASSVVKTEPSLRPLVVEAKTTSPEPVATVQMVAQVDVQRDVLDAPSAFSVGTELVGSALDSDLWAADPIGGAARRKATLKRAIPFAMLVSLGLGGLVALVVLSKEAEIPEMPPVAAVSPIREEGGAEPVAAPVVKAAEPVESEPAVAPVAAKVPSPDKVRAIEYEPFADRKSPVAAPVVTAPPVKPVVPDVVSLRGGEAAQPAVPAESAASASPVPARQTPVLRTASADSKEARAALVPPAAVRTVPPVAVRAVPPDSRATPAAKEPVATEEPDTFDGHMAAGNREVNRNPALAQEHFQLAAQARPGRVEPVTRLGDCAVRMGDVETAEKQYRAALKIGASFSPALLGMARVQKALGSASDARYYYTRYLDVNPKGSQAEEAQSYLERNP